MSFLTRIFPKNVKTLEEFIGFAEQGKVQTVSIEPTIDGNGSTMLLHETRINKGRRIVYREMITQRDGGFGAALAFGIMPGAVHKETLRTCLAGEKRVKELQRKLSGVTVRLTFEGRVMESFEKLHREAKAAGLF